MSWFAKNVTVDSMYLQGEALLGGLAGNVYPAWLSRLCQPSLD